jgi:hypothetical protein
MPMVSSMPKNSRRRLYAPNFVEVLFCELLLNGVLRSSSVRGS